jgi:D-beta-D-heptose 7-phosphate kinase/D-beta-D-heptose 1-phosphate adenosyltransferase
MIAVIGDIILDKFIFGPSTRLSQEAPVPVVNHERTEYRLGGAANVAANIDSLGQEVVLGGVISDDNAGSALIETLNSTRIKRFLALTKRKTTEKTRIIANNQQICRIDDEIRTFLTEKDEIGVEIAIDQILEQKPSIIIVSDYSKGVITPRILEYIQNAARDRKITVFLDPKLNSAATYRVLHWAGDIMTPNQSEAEGLSGIKIVDKPTLEQAGSYLINRFHCKYVLITRGEHGMTLFTSGGVVMLDLPTEARAVFDVSGAGDTVIATFATAYSFGYDIARAAALANKAAGIVVERRGTATVTSEEVGLAKDVRLSAK